MSDQGDSWRAYAHHDTVEGFIGGMEAYASAFTRLGADNPELANLAKEFSDFVAVIEPGVIARALRPAIDKMIDQDFDLDR